MTRQPATDAIALYMWLEAGKAAYRDDAHRQDLRAAYPAFYDLLAYTIGEVSWEGAGEVHENYRRNDCSETTALAKRWDAFRSMFAQGYLDEQAKAENLAWANNDAPLPAPTYRPRA